MTDRELLEKAAKAAGFEWKWSENGDWIIRPRGIGLGRRAGDWEIWDPLTDDGDRSDFKRLTPGEIERVSDLEVEIGQPMFRPKRFGVLGIHGVVIWAKDGRDRQSFDDEEAACAGLFGCGM